MSAITQYANAAAQLFLSDPVNGFNAGLAAVAPKAAPHVRAAHKLSGVDILVNAGRPPLDDRTFHEAASHQSVERTRAVFMGSPRDNIRMSRIRRAVRSDSDAVFSLAGDFATSFQPQREVFDQSFRYVTAQDDALLLVADGADCLLGYLLGFDHYTFYANGRVSWVEEIMVRPDRRREGLGRDLMLQFEQWAESRGSRLVALATRRAAPFYTALGYGESAIYFRKVL
jgi:GNAT superfamily N-acetyltransferase